MRLYRYGTDLFPALEEYIAASKKEILLVLFSFRHDKVGRRFIKLLGEKARTGVKVRVLFDAMASAAHAKKVRETLTRSGVEVEIFRPLADSLRLGLPAYLCRNHARLFLFDRKVFGVGGTGFGSQYLRREDLFILSETDDTEPLVMYFDYLWSLAHTKDSMVPLPESRTIGHGLQVVFSGPKAQDQEAYVWLEKAIASATHRITIMTPFFFPPRAILSGLLEAQRRGVRVEVITPIRTDKRWYDSFRALPAPILVKHGVSWIGTRKYFHQKMILIDEQWAVGSLNFDVVSLRRNYEVDIIGSDPAIMKQLEKVVNEAKMPRNFIGKPPLLPFLLHSIRGAAYTSLEALFSKT